MTSAMPVQCSTNSRFGGAQFVALMCAPAALKSGSRGVTTDMDPLSRIWTPQKISFLLIKVIKFLCKLFLVVKKLLLKLKSDFAQFLLIENKFENS